MKRSPFPSLSRSVAIALLMVAATGCAPTQRGEATMSSPTTSTFDPSAQVQPVTTLLRSYESALNASDVEAIVGLYATDGVFMAQHRSPSVGHDQIEAAYREILGMIRLNIAFEIDEVVVVSPTMAYARTRSAGAATILANDAQVSEGNQELFVLVRADASANWRIGRYIFSTTQPRS